MTIEPDSYQSIYWYGLAASNKHPGARKRLDELGFKSAPATTGYAKKAVEAHLALQRSSRDIVGRYEEISNDGVPDAMFRVFIKAPGQTVVALEIASVGEPYCRWDTTPGNSYWTIAVIKDGKLNNQADGTVAIPLNKSEEMWDLFVQDNDTIAAGKVKYELAVTFRDGTKQVYPISAGIRSGQ